MAYLPTMKANRAISKADRVKVRTDDMVDQSTNLIDKDRVIQDYYLNYIDEVTAGSGFAYTDYYMPINDAISFTGISRVNFYDKDKTFIHTDTYSTADAHTVKNTPNAFYIRVNIGMNYYDNVQLNDGETLLPYEPYRKPKLNNIAGELTERQVKGENVDLKVIQEKHVEFIATSSNIFDPSKTTRGYLNGRGEFVDDDTFVTLTEENFIPVMANSYSFKDVRRINFFDENKNHIITYTPASEPVTYDTSEYSYISINAYPTPAKESVQINVGDRVLAYEPYYYRLSQEKRVKIPINLKNVYKSDVLEGKSSADVSPIDDYVYTDMYAHYDDLVTNHPSYVSRTLILNDSEDRPIYRYDFKPEAIPNQSSSDPNNILPKILITTGAHGAEKSAIWVAYQMFRKMCEEWQTDEMLETLRFNVHFVVIPLNNPYSFDNDSRTNINGVDILRNFPNTFYDSTANTDPTSPYYRGTEPLSELETQAAWETYLEGGWNYVTDFHNFGGGEATDYYFLWIPGTDMFTQTMAQRFIRKMSNKWKQEYTYFPQDVETVLGYSNRNDLGVYGEAARDGIPATLTEIAGRVPADTDSLAFNSDIVTMGTEAITNWMYMNYLNHCETE